jgi:predicted dehydrogenase
MSQNHLGIGFIGGGFITRFHIQSLISVRNVDVMGVMSKTKTSAEESAAIARNIGVGDNARAYDSITEMIADPNIHALWVCSPNFARIETFEEIANAISSGKLCLIGVTCEKPLGRNVAEAQKVVELTKSVGLLDGYLENQVFSPSITRGKEIIWARGAATTGRPYLARAAEEHSGPHMPWFWEGALQGGGVLNDMMCHSVEEARFMLTAPGKPRDSIKPISISAHTDCLKWQRPEYIKILSDNSNGETDYSKKPSEDFARSLIEYLDEDGNKLIVETTTSWCFVGEGLRLSMELFGPEYSMFVNTLDPDLKVFFSRKVTGNEGEDLVEKQNAESGGMPVVSSEAEVYGYTAENRHMVESFLNGKRPDENFDDGLDVTRLLMAAYMSAEKEKTIKLPNNDIETFIPAVARGEWNPKG